MSEQREFIAGLRVSRLACSALALVALAASAEPVSDAALPAAQESSLTASPGYELRSSTMLVAVADESKPVSREALFDEADDFFLKLRPSSMLLAAADDVKPRGRDALFDDVDDSLPGAGNKADEGATSAASGLKGFLQFNLARDYQAPVHWSQMMTRADLSAQGRLGNGVKWKLGARMDYDAVYSLYDFYPGEVAENQRSNLTLRENYLDVGAGDWDFRVGKQNVVWGEMVGLFFADVVSARDMREFILPEFDIMRIPQWAARAEYFKDDFHAELLWIPVASYNEIGKPGAEFFPYSPPAIPGVSTQYLNEVFPSRTLANTNYGLRLSTLKSGWDISGFAYSSMDIEPTFFRQAVVAPQPTVSYEARHERIDQFGGTLAKDFGSVVLKGEGVYTHGRQFYVSTPSDSDGVVPQNTIDWALGLDFTLPAETRLNAQLFQRAFLDDDSDLLSDARENGYSLLLSHKLNGKLEAQLTWIASFNRTDWLLRPRLMWNFERNWRLSVGVDVFDGPPLGFFGRYADKDRVYSELRYNF